MMGMHGVHRMHSSHLPPAVKNKQKPNVLCAEDLHVSMTTLRHFFHRKYCKTDGSFTSRLGTHPPRG